jgi:nitroreductase
VEFFEVLASRHSVRTYRPDPVPEEWIIQCLEAARGAPSWRNSQCWRFVVVQDRHLIEQMAALRVYAYPINSWLTSAPAVIVACADPRESGSHGDLPYWAVDTAMENLVLAATAMGLGTCWVAGFDEKAICRLLGIPEPIRVVAYTPLGYPADKESLMGRTVKTIARSHVRKPLAKIVSRERWGGQW